MVVHSDSLQLHVKIPGYLAKSLRIHNHLIMTHTSSGRCVMGGGGGGGGGRLVSLFYG